MLAQHVGCPTSVNNVTKKMRRERKRRREKRKNERRRGKRRKGEGRKGKMGSRKKRKRRGDSSFLTGFPIQKTHCLHLPVHTSLLSLSLGTFNILLQFNLYAIYWCGTRVFLNRVVIKALVTETTCR